MIRIGIDVGGTNTDAVIMDGERVVASFKAPTSPDVMTGVSESLNGALTQSGVPAQAIDVVMLGTTHFTNAVVQRRGLAPTAAVRLGLPATEALPPMVDWPPELREAIGNRYYFAHGGHEFDGRVITPLDPDELRRIARDIAKRRIRTVAITSVFSPVNTEVERQAGEIIAAAVPGAHVTLSSDIGRIGLLERENAAIMNACLRDLSKTVMGASAPRSTAPASGGASSSRRTTGRSWMRGSPTFNYPHLAEWSEERTKCCVTGIDRDSSSGTDSREERCRWTGKTTHGLIASLLAAVLSTSA